MALRLLLHLPYMRGGRNQGHATCRTISQRPLLRESRARVHFIDDRFETVKAVREAPGLSNMVVYLAEWCALLPQTHHIQQCAADFRIRTLQQSCVQSNVLDIASTLGGIADLDCSQDLQAAPHSVALTQSWLACRGYNTDTERRRAQQMEGVQLLSLSKFCELLRWGIIMGVRCMALFLLLQAWASHLLMCQSSAPLGGFPQSAQSSYVSWYNGGSLS